MELEPPRHLMVEVRWWRWSARYGIMPLPDTTIKNSKLKDTETLSVTGFFDTIKLDKRIRYWKRGRMYVAAYICICHVVDVLLYRSARIMEYGPWGDGSDDTYQYLDCNLGKADTVFQKYILLEEV